MICRICSNEIDIAWLLPGTSKCRRCSLILHQIKDMANTPARAYLHLLNVFLARGVDD